MVQEIWNLGHSPKEVTIEGKYGILARHFNNYRVLYLNDLITNKDMDIPVFVSRFISKEGVVLMIANIVRDKCLSILFRSLTRKAFIDYGTTKGVFYGIGSLADNFKYGDPVIIVEGTADRDTLSQIYPNVLAVKSSSLSVIQCEILSRLTNKVILALDNDAAGEHGTNTAKQRLKNKSVKIEVLKYNGIKDAGTILEYKATGSPLYKEALEDLRLQVRGVLACIKD